MARFTDKVAIITGAGRGIGKGIAMGYAAEGGRVVVNDVEADVAEATVQEIRQAGGQAIAGVGSVTNYEDVQRIVQAAVDTWGTVDAVVNTAGFTRDAMAHKMTEEQFNAVLGIHLLGPFNMIRAIAPIFTERGKANPNALCNGKIVFISSTAALRGNPGQLNYATAKAGVLGMMMTLAKEWGRYRINVNAVAFGVIETRMTEFIRTDEKSVARLQPLIALGRWGTVEDAARPVLFLLSSDADYITGECLNVSGGLHMSLGA